MSTYERVSDDLKRDFLFSFFTIYIKLFLIMKAQTAIFVEIKKQLQKMKFDIYVIIK